MKTSYKTRMTDARHEKMMEDQRKEVMDEVRNGIMQPFGSQGRHRRKLHFPPMNNSNDVCYRLLPFIASVDPDLQAFWTVVTKPPFDAEKARRSEKRKRAKGGVGNAGLDGNFEDLDPLPMDDQNMQEMDMPQFEVRIL
jgi:hypothetical protein